MQRMIFHIPLPLQENPTSASGLRPVKMIEAFKSIGYEVFDITGYGAERKQKLKTLKQRISNGDKFEFLYSESSTQPTLLTEKHHLPTYPFIDFKLFKLCKSHNIKIGLFYRDIHWLFPFYNKTTSKFKSKVAKFFYRYDILNYKKYLDVMFLPSLEMAKYVPVMKGVVTEALPPGHGIIKKNDFDESSQTINVFYVGGMGSIYQMHELFNLPEIKNINLTISTRKENWDTVKSEYPTNDSIEITSVSGDALVSKYKQSHIGLLFVKPVEYWEFAMPFKLFEYIGYGLPIIASEGTLSAKFVEEHNIGWVIPYEMQSLKDLLEHLADHKSEIKSKTMNVLSIRNDNSWEARAKKVIKILT